jgi:hypothetical protein
MLPQVGQTVQFLRPDVPGARPLAGLITFVEQPTIVHVVYWTETGQMNFRSTTKFVPPGDPVPTSEYAAPLPVPGAPTVSPTKKP